MAEWLTEWLILLLLVPAIVVPVVLLVGFAGCDRVFGLQSFPPPQTPIVESAVGKSVSVITLTWTWTGAPQKFEFERTNPDSTTTPFEVPNDVPCSPFDDTGLTAATSFQYRVRSVFSDGSTTDWSASVTGTTLSFEPTFTQTLTSDGVNWQGFTLVQRIEPGRLFRSGTQVLLTLHASSTREALVDRIYISKPDPAAADPYQPDTDLTAVYDNSSSPLVVPKNTPQTPPLVVGPVNYNLDRTQPLLIAFDFHASPESDVALATVATGEASAYFIQGSEASSHPRSTGYTLAGSRVYLIEKIELG